MDSEAQRTAVKLLRKVAEAIAKMSPEQFSELSEASTVSFALIQPKKNAVKQSGPDRDWSDTLGKLQDLPTREEGRILLHSLALKKKELEQLARSLQLPIKKQDRADRLIDRIVESTIGARLNSRAVRGE